MRLIIFWSVINFIKRLNHLWHLGWLINMDYKFADYLGRRKFSSINTQYRSRMELGNCLLVRRRRWVSINIIWRWGKCRLGWSHLEETLAETSRRTAFNRWGVICSPSSPVISHSFVWSSKAGNAAAAAHAGGESPLRNRSFRALVKNETATGADEAYNSLKWTCRSSNKSFIKIIRKLIIKISQRSRMKSPIFSSIDETDY